MRYSRPGIFHFGEYSIGQAKAFMQQQGIEVRDD